MPIGLSQLPALLVILASTALAIGMAAEILSEVQDMQDCTDCSYGTNGTATWNVSENVIEGLNTMTGFLPVMGVIMIAAVVIGLIYLFR